MACRRGDERKQQQLLVEAVTAKIVDLEKEKTSEGVLIEEEGDRALLENDKVPPGSFLFVTL